MCRDVWESVRQIFFLIAGKGKKVWTGRMRKMERESVRERGRERGEGKRYCEKKE